MGQKSNSLTLKTNFFQPHLISINPRSTFNYLKFIKYFEFIIKKKGVLLLSRNLNVYNNQCYFIGNFFYSSYKTTFYKKKTKLKNAQAQLFKKAKLSLLFFKVLKILKTNLIVFSFSVLNRLVNRKALNFFFFKLKRYVNTIFQRRFTLFLDFLKIVCLLCQNLVSLDAFLNTLAQSFKSIDKRLHNQFLMFLKTLFKVMIRGLSNLNLTSISPLLGIKLILSGKFRGKARAGTKTLIEGSVPLQTVVKKVFFSKVGVYTLTGAFGLKVWLYKK